MNPSTRDSLSRIGGAAQGGSAKPPQEREKMDRERGEEPQDSPTGADTNKGTVGGTSNDNRSDSERAEDARKG